ncbi:hypothetical protein HNV10_04985 [Winogradskyella litoriviva]|uniref:Uncharacterized protein n=1 Tax=Winogradskyella litoriviva TaxID=1220182 RepID=A0ABX2E3F8_9FLAO|nr:hypothetical protein [Winogradskyella litoriviva]NRD22583.1 hypothetical protein [Winogradskyella litoriviva]
MNLSRTLNFLCILVGGLVAFYAQAQQNQNAYILIGGIALLIFGVYRTSRNIPSKLDNEDETFLKTEKEDEV